MKRALALAVVTLLFALPWSFFFGAVGWQYDALRVLPQRYDDEPVRLLAALISAIYVAFWCARAIEWALTTLALRRSSWTHLGRPAPGARLRDDDA